VGFIKGHPNQTASGERWLGFETALRESEFKLEPPCIEQGYFSYRSGLDAAEKLIATRPRPTAIFASNDDMAAAAVSVAHRRGLDVPRDLSVVGFDDSAIATTVWPELTTIRQPIASMAEAALDVLIRKIRKRRDGETNLSIDRLVAHELIVRQSAAAPPPQSD
jgi:LacI family transcriptional regulator